MRFEDFADFRVNFEPTVRTRFHDIELHACGPWSQGPVLPMALNILKGFDLKAMGHNSAEYIHVVTEALKLAFADRHNHFGDPKFVEGADQGAACRTRYAERRRSLISLEKAWPEMPPAGDPRHAARRSRTAGCPTPRVRRSAGTRRHFVPVRDRQRRQRVLVHAERRLGQDADHSGRRHPVLGARHAIVGRSHASVLGRAGQAPAAHAQSRDGVQERQGVHAVRHAGRRRAAQAMLQVFLNINVFGMDRAEPRSRRRASPSYSFPGSFEPHPYYPGAPLHREQRVEDSTREELRDTRPQGLRVGRESTWLAGAVCTIVADHKNGVLHGGADPRRPAYVLGW